MILVTFNAVLLRVKVQFKTIKFWCNDFCGRMENRRTWEFFNILGYCRNILFVNASILHNTNFSKNLEIFSPNSDLHSDKVLHDNQKIFQCYELPLPNFYHLYVEFYRFKFIFEAHQVLFLSMAQFLLVIHQK